jgi:hypothetical protein
MDSGPSRPSGSDDQFRSSGGAAGVRLVVEGVRLHARRQLAGTSGYGVAGLGPGRSVSVTTNQPNASAVNHAPVRWEDKHIGHVQFASILRDIGVRNSTAGDQTMWTKNGEDGDVFRFQLGQLYSIFD